MEEQKTKKQTKESKDSLKKIPDGGASSAVYQKMPFGFNGCSVAFGPMFSNVTEQDMINKAIAAKALGFTFQSSLGFGYLMTGDYPNACTSSPSLSWPIYLKSNQLAVPLYGQKTNMWCWAGTTQMTVAYQGVAITQCEQANARFGRTDCCVNPNSSDCRKGGWPDYNKWGFNSQQTAWSTALTFDQLVEQIDANHPTNFSWGWTGGGGHIMVARGYKNVNGVNYIYINDPWPVNTGDTRWITYTEYVSSSTHVHWRDYFNIIKR